MTLIQMQEQCIARMHEPRTSIKRESKHRRSVARHYLSWALAQGYNKDEANAQLKDIYDVYRLQRDAEE